MPDQIVEKPIEKIKAAANQAARAESEPPHVRHYRTVIFQIVLALVVVAFAVLTFLVKIMPSFAIDLQITKAIQSINFQPFDLLMIWISWPGFSPQSIIISALIIFLIYGFGLHWESIVSVFAAAIPTAIDVLLKNLIQRPRPPSNVVNVFSTLNSYSFPSGHVLYYAVFFGFFWFLAFTLLKPSIKRSLLLVINSVLVALIGFSRIYRGEHWASDVLGSYLLGSILLVAIIQFYLWGKKRYLVKQPVAAAPPQK